MTLKVKGTPIYNHVTTIHESQIQSHSLYQQPLLSYRQFRDQCSEWPQMILNTEMAKVLHIHVTTTPGFQISPRFTVYAAIYELQAILRQVHRMTPKLPWTKTIKGTPCTCDSYPCDSYLCVEISIRLYGETFSSYRPLETRAPNYPGNGPEH